MRTPILIACLAMSSSVYGQPSRAPAAVVPAAARGAQPAPAQRPAPTYVVVEGSHTEDAAVRQQLTVLCPATHRALGAGYTGVMTVPGANGAPALAPVGVDGVRSIPDSTGGGWQVEASAPDAARAQRPWRLVVRVTCLRVPG